MHNLFFTHSMFRYQVDQENVICYFISLKRKHDTASSSHHERQRKRERGRASLPHVLFEPMTRLFLNFFFFSLSLLFLSRQVRDGERDR